VLTLIRKLRRGAAAKAFSAPVDVGEGVIYAVGDVHGRRDLLGRLLERVLAESAGLPGPPRLVFLGDYIDRGEDVRQTVELLRGLEAGGEIEPVFLMGNHEQMLLRFLRDPAEGDRWLRYGGLQTLMSYGVGGVPGLRAGEEAVRVRDELIAAMGPHLGFIEALRPCYRAGNVFFAHAGADPAIPPEEQPLDTLLWGCESFHRMDRSDGVWVVHGHFVVERPAAEHGRIPVDTGAYFSGRLTAARIGGGEVTFLEG